MLHLHPSDRLVCQIVIEYVVGLTKIGFNRPGVFVERRMPLVAVATNESVEILKYQSARPQVKRASLTRHPVWHVVHLAKPGSVVTILPEHFTHGTRALGY